MSRFTNLNNFTAAQTTVTVSGTPVQVGAQRMPDGVGVVVKADDRNTGILTVGNSSANALNTTANNFRLQAGSSVTLYVNNANDVWVDSTVSGDRADVIYEL